MDAAILQLNVRSLHLQQAKALKSTAYAPAQGANGVVPLCCWHDSLHALVNAPWFQENFGGSRVIQLGHWTACPWVYDAGFKWCGKSSDVVCFTEASVGDLERLVMAREPRNLKLTTRDLAVKTFNWTSLTNSIESNQSRIFFDTSGLRTLVAPAHLVFRELASSVPSAVAIHVITTGTVHNASEYWKFHDSAYWSKDIIDVFTPANVLERQQLVKDELCDLCRARVDGVAVEAAPVSAPEVMQAEVVQAEVMPPAVMPTAVLPEMSAMASQLELHAIKGAMMQGILAALDARVCIEVKDMSCADILNAMHLDRLK